VCVCVCVCVCGKSVDCKKNAATSFRPAHLQVFIRELLKGLKEVLWAYPYPCGRVILQAKASTAIKV